MTPLEKKIAHTISFFAVQFEKASRERLWQDILLSYLFYLDFWSLEKTGKPAFNLPYKTSENLLDVYRVLMSIDSGIFSYALTTRTCAGFPYAVEYRFSSGMTFRSKARANLDEFSPKELVEMRRLLETYAAKWDRRSERYAPDYKTLLAWNRAKNTAPGEKIDFKLHFLGDIEQKNDLTPEEESYLIYRALNRSDVLSLMKPGDIFCWQDFPLQKNGEIKNLYFLYLGKSKSENAPGLIHLLAITSQVKYYERYEARASRCIFRIDRDRYPFFASDCLIDLDVAYHETTAEYVRAAQIEKVGSFDLQDLSLIFNKMVEAGTLSPNVLNKISTRLTETGCENLRPVVSNRATRAKRAKKTTD